jgi:beta-RFAP synthase
MMVHAPGIELQATSDRAWAAQGPLSERALRFAHQFNCTVSPDLVRPMRFVVARAAPEHSGLGTGTQLGMAVAKVLAVAYGLRHLSASELAERLGRGGRSALGIHGFAQGGFLVEAGKSHVTGIAPLIARLPFPESWRVVIVLSPWKGCHGSDEFDAFQTLSELPQRSGTTDALCRLVLLGMLPALLESDLRAFGQAVFEFNVRTGELFVPVQGGVYSHPRVADLVDFIRRQGIAGAGQSSWGPTVFGICQDSDHASAIAQRIRAQYGFSAEEAFVARPCNRGASAEEIEGS